MSIHERVQILADEAVKAYELPSDAEAVLMSISENATFRVENRQGPLGALRVYRAKNQTLEAIVSELTWIKSVAQSDFVNTPSIIKTKDGREYGEILQNGVTPRYYTLFEYVEGTPPASNRTDIYKTLGNTVAKLHNQVLNWTPPADFERSAWDIGTILGPSAPWGNWRSGPDVTEELKITIGRAEDKLRKRLANYTQDSSNSGLVHGDLREANLIMDANDELWVIDYDDAGFSWLIWDLASSTSFLEASPNLTDIVDSWLDGYTGIRELRPEDFRAVPDIVFLRRLHLLAWMGSHPDGSPVEIYGDGFAEGTGEIAKAYLDGTYLKDSSWISRYA